MVGAKAPPGLARAGPREASWLGRAASLLLNTHREEKRMGPLLLETHPDPLGQLLGSHLLHGFEVVLPDERLALLAGGVAFHHLEGRVDLEGDPQVFEGVL